MSVSLTLEDARTLIYSPYNNVATEESITSFWPDVAKLGPPAENTKTWTRILLTHGDGRQASLAGDGNFVMWGMTGFMTVQLFTPSDSGSTKALQIATKLLTAYRKAKGSVWFRNPRIREIGPSGNYYQINFFVDFQYYQIQ